MDDAIQEYLEATVIPLRLGCTTESGWPAVISLWFLVDEGALYCATQADARVVAYLQADDRCAFEVAGDRPPYCGVRGQARASIEPERGLAVLQRLLDRYLGGDESKLARLLLDNADNEVAIRLEPVNLTTWNFSARMEGVPGAQPDKPCPPS
ncbi:MAG: pyridoxamine 5'-phosphate oxidase family protein [Candidatus Promineifilaceae bacterium]|nr:pyridoxamine 5'-phosphate oxidase family protein [Candidatus Promineifilaceae bacterium]